MGILINRFGVSYYVANETQLRRLLQLWADDDQQRAIRATARTDGAPGQPAVSTFDDWRRG